MTHRFVVEQGIAAATAVMQTACNAQIFSARPSFVHKPVALMAPELARSVKRQRSQYSESGQRRQLNNPEQDSGGGFRHRSLICAHGRGLQVRYLKNPRHIVSTSCCLYPGR
jgi:hypothetical protein